MSLAQSVDRAARTICAIDTEHWCDASYPASQSLLQDENESNDDELSTWAGLHD